MPKRKISNIKRSYAVKRRSGLPPKESVYEIIEENTVQKFGKLKVTDEKSLEHLKQKVFPGKARARTELLLSKQLMKSKRKLIENIFGLKGEKLGLLLIQPEAIDKTPEVRKFLVKMGVKVIYSKPLMFSKSLAYRIFGERQFVKYPDFAISVARLMSGPSRVLVFTHPVEGYAAKSPMMHYLKVNDLHKFAQKSQSAATLSSHGAFNRLVKGAHDSPERGTIRYELIRPRLAKEGTSEKLDSFGYFRANPTISLFAHLAGVHAPVQEEFFKEAANFFTKKELQKIAVNAKKV